MGNREVQKLGEDAAAAWLHDKGWRILERNWRIPRGELDIIAADGSTLVFVEVRTRRSAERVPIEEWVDYRKARRIRRLGEAYISYRRPQFEQCRFDVITVLAAREGTAINHVCNAF